MIELVIEQSTNGEGEALFEWSVWDDDRQIQTVRTTHFSVSQCEANAVEFCWRELGFKPDKVTRR